MFPATAPPPPPTMDDAAPAAAVELEPPDNSSVGKELPTSVNSKYTTFRPLFNHFEHGVLYDDGTPVRSAITAKLQLLRKVTCTRALHSTIFHALIKI